MDNYNQLKEEVQALSSSGRYVDAIKKMNEYIEVVKQRDGEDSSRIVTLLNDLAGMYRNVGFYDEAEETFQTVLKEIDAKQGVDNEQYATTVVNLACMYRFVNKHEKAEQLFLGSLKTYDKLDADTVDEFEKLYANASNNLGVLYYDMGRHEEAIVYHERALEILKKINLHEYIATTLNNIATAKLELGEHKQAIELLDQSLAIFDQEGMTEHPLYHTVINNIGAIYFQEGKLNLAVSHFTEALEVMRASYGEYSPQYLDCYHNLQMAKETLNNE